VTDNPENYFQYWGKAAQNTRDTDQQSYHLLAYHCLDVAAVGNQILSHDPILLKKIIPQSILESNPERECWFSNVIAFLLALHDAGKFSVRFQNLRQDITQKLNGQTDARIPIPHTIMGRLLFDKVFWPKFWTQNFFDLDQNDDSVDWQEIWDPWMFAMTGHHGAPPQKPDNPLSDLFNEKNQQSAVQFVETCAGLFLNNKLPHLQLRYNQYYSEFIRSSWILAGLAVMSDWIGSNNKYFSYQADPMPLDTYWKDYALPRAEKAVRAFGVLPATISQQTGMHALFPHLSIPTPLQIYAESCSISPDPQLFIIEEATGSGKTEAALVLAHRMMAQGLGEGIYFGLPTMATANAMYERMGKSYEKLFTSDSKPSLILAQSARKLSEKFRQSIGYSGRTVPEQQIPDDHNASTQCTAWLADNRKKALLAQIGVGTIDQALMGVLPLHHQSLRLLGLARNILIVDEIHAYDSYVETVLENLLQFHAASGGSAILLSATLPQAQRQTLVSSYSTGLGKSRENLKQSAYPLVTRLISKDVQLKEDPVQKCEMTHRTIEVECTSDDALVMDYLSKTFEAGRCACWIQNTVDDAIETYQTLSKIFGEDHVLLFHARFTMGDRICIEQKVLNLFGKDSKPDARRKMILVATQVVEQSLDLDFDLMITDLAPMDLIIQRSGRLHRHKRADRKEGPRLVVRIPKYTDNPSYDWYKSRFPKGAYVYENHGQLWLTARLLMKREKITMPDDARLLIEGTFGESVKSEIPENLTKHAIKADGKKMAEEAIAQLNILRIESGYTDKSYLWQMENEKTPTRLGAPRVTILLLKWYNSKLDFFASDSEFAEQLSQVSIPETKISTEFSYTGDLGSSLKTFKETLSDKGKWRILIPLTDKNNEWSGYACDKKGDKVTVKYDSRLGLRTIKS